MYLYFPVFIFFCVFLYMLLRMFGRVCVFMCVCVCLCVWVCACLYVDVCACECEGCGCACVCLHAYGCLFNKRMQMCVLHRFACCEVIGMLLQSSTRFSLFGCVRNTSLTCRQMMATQELTYVSGDVCLDIVPAHENTNVVAMFLTGRHCVMEHWPCHSLWRASRAHS